MGATIPCTQLKWLAAYGVSVARQLITDWLAQQQNQSFPKGTDQCFLAEVVYPLAVKDACIHHARPDAYLDAPQITFKDETRLPFPTKRRSGRDYVVRVRGRKKCLVALSIDRKNGLSNSRINQLIKYLNSIVLPKRVTLRFYVADHLDASLHRKLQCSGQVIENIPLYIRTGILEATCLRRKRHGSYYCGRYRCFASLIYDERGKVSDPI